MTISVKFPTNITTLRDKALEHRERLIRVAAFLLTIAVGYVLVEFTWNENAFSLEPRFFAANILLLAFVFSIVYFLGQRSRASIVVFLGICLVMGIANYYVVSFKGQPVVPADLFALNTAAAVSEGYSYAPSAQMVLSIVLFVAFCASLRFVPKVKLSARSVVFNTVFGLALLAGFCWYMDEGSLEEDLDIIVGEWNTLWYYENQGTTLCFVKRVQDIMPDAPDGYSSARVSDALEDPLRTVESGATVDAQDAFAAAAIDVATSSENEAESDVAALTGSLFVTEPAMGATAETLASFSSAFDGELPNVLVIMNETFSDISQYDSLEGTAAYPANFYRIAQDALVSGTAYVSCFGAGTCNSEFEVLTGSSMAHLGEDVYPYVLYDLAGNENLASYFKALGYDTTAMHPADAQNWRRDRIYDQLGFDTFISGSAFSEAEKLRWFTTDLATYENALSIIEENDAPQFIFDVTIQNHGGYDTGLIPEEYAVSAPVQGVEYSCANEFASLIQRSDADLACLIEQLEIMEEPVIVLFFGDHQPSLSEIPEEVLYGQTLDESTLEQLQERYEVPYFIWANYDAQSLFSTAESTSAYAAGAIRSQTCDTSLNYLGSMLVRESGLPLTAYQQLLLLTQQFVPAINLHGVMDADGAWHSLDDVAQGLIATHVATAVEQYAIVQHGNLFDTSSASSLFVRAAS